MDGTTVNATIRRCLALFGFRNNSEPIAISGTGLLVENSVFVGGHRHLMCGAANSGGAIRNCTFIAGGDQAGVYISPTLTAGPVNVNNCIFFGCRQGLRANTVGDVIEDYNGFADTFTPRVNVSAGANSATYHYHIDPRSWMESVFGGDMLSFIDMAVGSPYIDLSSGTGAPATDARGTSQQGAAREWGALEYDATLDIEAGSGGGASPLGSPIVRGGGWP